MNLILLFKNAALTRDYDKAKEYFSQLELKTQTHMKKFLSKLLVSACDERNEYLFNFVLSLSAIHDQCLGVRDHYALLMLMHSQGREQFQNFLAWDIAKNHINNKMLNIFTDFDINLTPFAQNLKYYFLSVKSYAELYKRARFDWNAFNDVNNQSIIYSVLSNAEMLSLFLQHGVDVNGNSTPCYRRIRNNPPLLEFIKSADKTGNRQTFDQGLTLTYPLSPLLQAIKGNWTESAKILIENEDVVLNGTSFAPQTLKSLCDLYAGDLRYIETYNEIKVLRTMTEALDKNLVPRNPNALMLAVYLGNLDIAETLLKKGINVDLQDVYGETALMYAVVMNRVEMIQLIMAYSPNLSICNYKEESAYYLASSFKNAHVVRLFDGQTDELTSPINSEDRTIRDEFGFFSNKRTRVIYEASDFPTLVLPEDVNDESEIKPEPLIEPCEVYFDLDDLFAGNSTP